MSDLHAIQSDADLEKALARVEEIFFAEEGTPEGQELEGLVKKITAYESTRFPREVPEPVEAIKFMMEQRAHLPEDLVCSAFSLSDFLEVLAGTRSLSIEMATNISEQLAIPLEILWPESENSLEGGDTGEKTALPTIGTALD